MISAELEAALRDGGNQAVTLVLHEAIKRNDFTMIACLLTYVKTVAPTSATEDQNP